MAKKITKKGGALKAVLGLAGLAAVAGGTYALYGSKNAAKNRSTVKGWAKKAKAEVLKQAKKVENFSEKEYNSIVSEVVGRYKKMKAAEPKEIEHFVKSMKAHYVTLAKSAKKAIKKARS